MTIRNIIHKIKCLLATIFVKLGVLDKMVLVRVDGGICSQIHFYLIGQYYKLKGYTVKYDLSWFQIDGKNLDGSPCGFVLTEAFPDVNIPVASKIECFFYSVFSYKGNFFDDIIDYDILDKKVPPLYLDGYYLEPRMICRSMFSSLHLDYSVLQGDNSKMYEHIMNTKDSVAIHVRRGDLSGFNAAYGFPVTSDYINGAINHIKKVVGSPYFFIFSDDSIWVKENLIHELDFADNYEVVDINKNQDTDQGHWDLLLISACEYQIASKGSAGKYGAFLKGDDMKMVILFDDEYERKVWDNISEKVIFLK